MSDFARIIAMLLVEAYFLMGIGIAIHLVAYRWNDCRPIYRWEMIRFCLLVSVAWLPMVIIALRSK